MSDVRYLFIIGTGRCGSTLVQELIAQHPDVGFISNVDMALAPFNPKGRANRLLTRAVTGAPIAGRSDNEIRDLVARLYVVRTTGGTR